MVFPPEANIPRLHRRLTRKLWVEAHTCSSDTACTAVVYVCRSLHRCRQLAVHAELVQLQSGRVLLTDDSSCHGCGRLIGGKVFVVLPSGVVMCSRCSGAVGNLAAEAAAGGGVSG